MGRYLVIEFDDNKQADSLRAQIDKATRGGKGFRVVGLFARPNKRSCTCVRARSEYKPGIVQRGAKYGWWVCTTCKHPRLGRQDLKNLLTPDQVLDPHVAEGIDMLETQPQRRVYQPYLGELTTWPIVRMDIEPTPAGVEGVPEVVPHSVTGEPKAILSYR